MIGRLTRRLRPWASRNILQLQQGYRVVRPGCRYYRGIEVEGDVAASARAMARRYNVSRRLKDKRRHAGQPNFCYIDTRPTAVMLSSAELGSAELEAELVWLRARGLRARALDLRAGSIEIDDLIVHAEAGTFRVRPNRWTIRRYQTLIRQAHFHGKNIERVTAITEAALVEFAERYAYTQAGAAFKRLQKLANHLVVGAVARREGTCRRTLRKRMGKEGKAAKKPARKRKLRPGEKPPRARFNLFSVGLRRPYWRRLHGRRTSARGFSVKRVCDRRAALRAKWRAVRDQQAAQLRTREKSVNKGCAVGPARPAAITEAPPTAAVERVHARKTRAERAGLRRDRGGRAPRTADESAPVLADIAHRAAPIGAASSPDRSVKARAAVATSPPAARESAKTSGQNLSSTGADRPSSSAPAEVRCLRTGGALRRPRDAVAANDGKDDRSTPAVLPDVTVRPRLTGDQPVRIEASGARPRLATEDACAIEHRADSDACRYDSVNPEVAPATSSGNRPPRRVGVPSAGSEASASDSGGALAASVNKPSTAPSRCADGRSPTGKPVEYWPVSAPSGETAGLPKSTARHQPGGSSGRESSVSYPASSVPRAFAPRRDAGPLGPSPLPAQSNLDRVSCDISSGVSPPLDCRSPEVPMNPGQQGTLLPGGRDGGEAHRTISRATMPPGSSARTASGTTAKTEFSARSDDGARHEPRARNGACGVLGRDDHPYADQPPTSVEARVTVGSPNGTPDCSTAGGVGSSVCNVCDECVRAGARDHRGASAGSTFTGSGGGGDLHDPPAAGPVVTPEGPARRSFMRAVFEWFFEEVDA